MTQKKRASSDAIWTAKDAQKITNGSVNGDWTAYGISIDSRMVEEGDVFVALQTEAADGHD